MTVDFQAFIRGVHTAVSSANDALADQNLEVLNTYFEPTDSADSSDRIETAIDAAESVVESREGSERAQEVFQELRDALEGREANPRGASASLRPRMVSLQYPQQTAEGVRIVDVNVPLVTLVPVTQARVESVTLRANLDLSVDGDDRLRVGFSPSTGSPDDEGGARRERPGMATLEITVRPDDGSTGLKRLIEGYERVLRAQIPS